MMRKTRKKAGFIADNKYLSLQILENKEEDEAEEEEGEIIAHFIRKYQFLFCFSLLSNLLLLPLSSSISRFI